MEVRRTIVAMEHTVAALASDEHSQSLFPSNMRHQFLWSLKFDSVRVRDDFAVTEFIQLSTTGNRHSTFAMRRQTSHIFAGHVDLRLSFGC